MGIKQCYASTNVSTFLCASAMAHDSQWLCLPVVLHLLQLKLNARFAAFIVLAPYCRSTPLCSKIDMVGSSFSGLISP
jgi:hypothetical protein